MNICVLGDTDDLSSVYLAWAARRAGHRVLLLDEEGLGPTWSFAFDDSAVASGVIETEAAPVDIGDLAGAFARFDPEPGPLPGLDLDPIELQHFRAERRAGLHQLIDHLPCPVANRSSAGRSNGSKPLQMELLRAAGFSVPAWLVSNERDRVLDFLEGLDGSAIYKAVSGLRSHVRKLDDGVLQLLGEGTSPVLVQVYVEGVDVRVHVVDEECFGTEIASLGVDYRFDGSLAYRVREVPEGVAGLCREVARQEGLLLAGFDFRVDPEGEWFCLEVNPMPSFIPYEWATGQPIAETLLEVFEFGRQAPSGDDAHSTPTGKATMKTGCELSTRTAIRAFYAHEHLLIVAEGELPSPGFYPDIEQRPERIFPPRYSVRRCPRPGIFPQVVTPFRHAESFRLGERLETVTVFHADGSDEVSVEDCGGELAPYAQTVGAEEGCPEGADQATGFSKNLSFDEAFAEAVASLPPIEDPNPDQLERVRVLEVGALFGGIAGFHDLTVTICRTHD